MKIKYNIFLILVLLCSCVCFTQQNQGSGDGIEVDGGSKTDNSILGQEGYDKMLKMMYLLNKYILSDIDSGSQNQESSIKQQIKMDANQLQSYSQKYENVMRLRNSHETCQSKSSQFKLTASYSADKLQLQLLNYIDYDVYAGEFNTNHIGSSIHRKLELLDVYQILCTKPQIYEGFMSINETVMRDLNQFGDFRISREGVIAVQNIIYALHYKQVLHSFLKLNRIRKMTQSEINQVKKYQTSKTQLQHVYRQNLQLSSKINKLQQQIEMLKSGKIDHQQNYQKPQQHNFANPHKYDRIQQQQQLNMLPMFIFSAFGLFIVYNIIRTQKNVKRYTTANRFLNFENKLQQFKFVDNTITKVTTGDWVRLIDSSQIFRRKQFKIKINNMDKWAINIGLMRVNRMQDGIQKDKVITYGSNCIYYNDNTMKLKEGGGFREGQTVKIIVDVAQNYVKWEVQGESRYILHDLIKGYTWKLAIEMRGNGDSIQFIE